LVAGIPVILTFGKGSKVNGLRTRLHAVRAARFDFLATLLATPLVGEHDVRGDCCAAAARG
jgi:hypothetical protein